MKTDAYIIHPNHVRPWSAKIPVGVVVRFRCSRLEDGRYLLEFDEFEEIRRKALEAKP